MRAMVRPETPAWRWLAAAGQRARWPAREAEELVRALGRPESLARTRAAQIAKATVAAIVAWYLASELLGSEAAWLAPTTAVLMVHSTVYRSVTEGVKRVVAVAAGVAVAATAGTLIGLNAFGLLLVVPLSLLGARLRWIGAQGEYIAVTAVVLLTFGVSTDENFLLSYLTDTVVGCVTGAAVNMLLLPPAYQRSARGAVSELASDTARLLRELAEGARSGWRAGTAGYWRRRSEQVNETAQAAQTALAWSRESRRWNPWPRRDGRLPAGYYQPAVDTLWHVSAEIRGLVSSMQEAVPADDGDAGAGGAGGARDGSGVQSDVLTAAPPLYDDLAPLLESVAEVVETYGDEPNQEQDFSPRVARTLERAEELHADLTRQLPQVRMTDPTVFEVTGTILQDVRRILRHLRDAGARSYRS